MTLIQRINPLAHFKGQNVVEWEAKYPNVRNSAERNQRGGKMTTRPATSLANAIDARLKRNKGARISVSRRSMFQWLQWAKSINASMRLDGSPRSRHKRGKKQ